MNLSSSILSEVLFRTPSVWENKSQLRCKTDFPDQIDTNMLSEHMAFSAEHVPKVPQALFSAAGSFGEQT